MNSIGKYEIVEKIGSGGFGEVFRARDPYLKRDVAVKTCTFGDDDLRRRFLREAEIVGRLRHRNITLVFDFGFHDGVPYLVQEFLPGEDLEDLVRRQEPLGQTIKLDYLVQIAEGLEYAHAQGVIHRDVKPANIRIVDRAQVKIMDFGVGKLAAAETQLTIAGTTMGTPGYLAPEQLRGERLDERVDIFSYGVLAYELLTYRKPFRGDSVSAIQYQILNHDPPSLDALPGFSPEIARLVDACLEKDRRYRVKSFALLLDQLRPLAQHVSSAPPTMVLPDTTIHQPADTILDTSTRDELSPFRHIEPELTEPQSLSVTAPPPRSGSSASRHNARPASSEGPTRGTSHSFEAISRRALRRWAVALGLLGFIGGAGLWLLHAGLIPSQLARWPTRAESLSDGPSRRSGFEASDGGPSMSIVSVESMLPQSIAVQRIQASSETSEHPAHHAADGSSSTFWHSGGLQTDWLLLTLPGEQELTRLELVGGRIDPPEHFSQNNRLKTVRVRLSDGTSRTVTLDDVPEYQSVLFEPAVRTSILLVEIEDVYPGSRWHHNIVTEIRLWGR